MRDLIPEELQHILASDPILHNSCLVGGCVRDSILGIAPKDYDVEVYGTTFEQLRGALEPFGRVDMVGKAFGIIKLFTQSGHDYDFSIPRRESKVGAGHRGFVADFDPSITPHEAAARRDFTFNALAYDVKTGQLLDFFGGVEDLKKKILRHTSAAFADDPLRVLRGFQFCGRFNLEAAPETIEICRQMKPKQLISPPGSSSAITKATIHGDPAPEETEGLSVERVREEWMKWASKSVKPSAGLRFLVQTGWVDFFPEIKDLMDCPQEPEWHPEGDVFVHTSHCCDAMATIPEWQGKGGHDRAVYMLAILAHDFAKPSTTAVINKNGKPRITAHGHEEAGAPMAQKFLERLGMPRDIVTRVPPLVADHLAHITTQSDKAIRRLARRLHPETVDGLWLIMAADHMGRPPLPQVPPEGAHRLRQRAQDLQVHQKPQQPFLLGRDLLALGVKPGKHIGEILAAAFEAQTDGEFADKDGALAWYFQRYATVPAA